MTGNALALRAKETLRRTAVAFRTFDAHVRAGQRKERRGVDVDDARTVLPAGGVVAALAIEAELGAMRIFMAVSARATNVREAQIAMAAGAVDAFVREAEGEAGVLRMIEQQRPPQRRPPLGRMAIRTLDGDGAVWIFDAGLAGNTEGDGEDRRHREHTAEERFHGRPVASAKLMTRGALPRHALEPFRMTGGAAHSCVRPFEWESSARVVERDPRPRVDAVTTGACAVTRGLAAMRIAMAIGAFRRREAELRDLLLLHVTGVA